MKKYLVVLAFVLSVSPAWVEAEEAMPYCSAHHIEDIQKCDEYPWWNPIGEYNCRVTADEQYRFCCAEGGAGCGPISRNIEIRY